MRLSTTIIHSSLILLAIATSSGCGQSTEQVAASEGAQTAEPGPKVAKLGEACGGNADEPIALCEDGLYCFEPSDLEPGKCQKHLAKLGESCGGNADESIADCEPGLQCYEPSDLEPGKCQKHLATLGEACGGNGDEPIGCEAGLECDEPSDLELGKCRAE